jgi:hypothetical protein
MRAYKLIVPAALCFAAVASLGGCCCNLDKTPTPPLGAQSDSIWRRQEAGAAASDFVIYQHEFVMNDTRLNAAGEDHLRSIAARLHCGAPVPVVVEQSMTSEKSDTEHHYPVHPNPELDMKRRDVIVKSLVGLGIANADQCVLVAPPLAPGETSTESARSYERGMTGWGHSQHGFGGSTAGGLGGIGVGGNIH